MKECSRLISLIVLAVLTPAGLALGQATSEPGASAGQYPRAANPVYSPATYSAQNQFWASNAYAPGQAEIAKLVKELGEAEDSNKKAEITKQLEAEVIKSFDQDMEQRETDLKNLEERVKKLRTQLDRRRRAKDDIVQLQLKVLANEAEGLGFGGQRFQSGASPKASTRSPLAPTSVPPRPASERLGR